MLDINLPWQGKKCINQSPFKFWNTIQHIGNRRGRRSILFYFFEEHRGSVYCHGNGGRTKELGCGRVINAEWPMWPLCNIWPRDRLYYCIAVVLLQLCIGKWKYQFTFNRSRISCFKLYRYLSTFWKFKIGISLLRFSI